MGSPKFITIPQAAALIGCSERSVFRYTKKGILHWKHEGRSTLVSEEDVRTLRKGRHDAASMTSTVKRDIVTKLQIEVQTLKTQMATVMRLLNVRHEPLNFTLPEYKLFYQSAEQMSTEGWSPHVEEMWAEYFVRVTVEDLEGIERATEDKHPWRPLLRLVTTMHLNPYDKALTEMLAAGRTNIQHIAGVWCVLREESPRTFDILQERDAAPLKKLVRRMARSQS